MIAELKERSQLTIPKKIVTEMGLKSGDQFEVIVVDGVINLVPVVVYPKARIEKLEALAVEALSKSKSGKLTEFNDPHNLLAFLHKED
jgi:AbrB family looped-hinge helix DNA binding protein